MRTFSVLKLAIVGLVFSHAAHTACGSEPDPLHATSAFDLEQRLNRLESILSPEGCVDSSGYHPVCPPASSVYAGYKFLFMKPQMKESFEATVTDFGTGQLTLIPLDYDFNVTPNVWLGFRTEQSLGVRVNYWGFDHNGNNQTLVSDGVRLPGATATTVIYPAAIIAPAPGDILQTRNSLNVQTIDLEGTYDVQVQAATVTVGGGIRYASTDQHMQAAATRLGFPIGLIEWRREFEGFGPTVSAAVNQPLVAGLSAVGSLRGSLLYGQKDLNRTVVGDVTPAVVAGSPTVRLNNADEVVAAADLGVGLRYTMALNQQSEAFVQGTFEGQLWTEAGAPTLTFLGFQGLGLALGFAY